MYTIMLCAFFCDLLFSFSTFLGFIHVARSCPAFPFTVVFHCMKMPDFSILLLDIWVVPSFLATLNNAAMCIHVLVSWCQTV